MIFSETRLAGAFLIELEPHADERGFFARSYCREELEAAGLEPAIAQCNISFNKVEGTIRGMHYQAAPHQEVKLVRCTRGAIYDVIVDLRDDSPTYGQWISTELSADNRRTLYVPEGFAHGFQTLQDGCEVFYQMSVPYAPDSVQGVRFDDPTLAIEWPIAQQIVSDRDRQLPSFAA